MGDLKGSGPFLSLRGMVLEDGGGLLGPALCSRLVHMMSVLQTVLTCVF